MLERMYDILNEKFENPVKSWDSLVEFIAVDHRADLLYQLEHKFEWLYEDRNLADRLSRIYDAEILQADYHDCLGELYRSKLASEAVEQDEGQLELALQRWTQPSQEGKRIAVLDPEAGTGRLLMTVHKKLPEAVLFGIDYDLRALRVAMTNFAIHNIQGFLLHADRTKHDMSLDTPKGQYNWKHANKWYSRMDKLKPAPKPH